MQNTSAQLAATSAASSHRSDGPAFRVPTSVAPPEQRWSFYLNGSAAMARQGATVDSLKSDYTIASGTLGGDYRVTENIAIGAFGGYSHIDANLDEVGSTSEIETGTLGLYATQRWGALFLDGVFAYGHNVYDNKRIVQGTANTSKPEGDQFAVQAKMGHEFKAGAWTLIPEVGAQFTKLTLDRFTESGANALEIQAQEVDSLRSTTGGTVRYDWPHAWNGRLLPRARAAWVHEFMNGSRNILYRAQDPAYIGITGILPTAQPERDFAVIGCGLDATLGEQWALSIDYDLEVGREKFTAHQTNAGVRYSF
jgi:outer membrane autotransporter protein